MKKIKAGETFEFEGKTFKAVKSKMREDEDGLYGDCRECFFCLNGCNKIKYDCCPKDEPALHFVEVK